MSYWWCPSCRMELIGANVTCEENCNTCGTRVVSVDQNISQEELEIALEKQIPKIATETQELMEVEYICPECKCINGQRFNYCWNCGQAITHS